MLADLSPSSLATRPATGTQARPRVVVEALEPVEERLAGLEAGLLAQPAWISPKFFYDEQGCALYNAICQLAEYYPTRLENAICATHRAEIASYLPSAGQWVDLGCGDGHKSWPWLGVTMATRYVGVDIAPEWLRQTLRSGMRQFPQVEFLGIVTDFTRPLHLQAILRSNSGLPPVFFYPGSSIGNFEPAAALALLTSIRGHLGREGRLLIGVDAPKDPAILEAAYDDALGVTAAFNRNVLRVVNRALDCDFEPRHFRHRAWFNEAESRVEMLLVADRLQHVRIGSRLRDFAPGDAIITEYSYKYTPARFEALLAQAGFAMLRRWSDERGWFHLYVAAPLEGDPQ
ncbi:L-histidine N(alpha)-methyltransferase [Chitinimonas lacunae]|uniref:L-histidine N(Alpha)-methyltransferase n=1 Tax=Chitinimonas lacunae TaxID=1963018 RepID=A0ABV8MMN7_9NEIS